MPLPGRVSGSRDALSLLKLASEIPPDSFPALLDAAASSVSIIEAIADFTSNSNDWAGCAQYVGSAVESVIRDLGTRDPPEGDVGEKMGDLLDVLKKIKAKIDRLQQVPPSWLNRVWCLLKGHQLVIAEIETQLNAVLVLFGLLPDARFEYSGTDSKQLLARVMEIYGASLVVENPSIRSTAGAVNQNTSPSDSTNALATVSAMVASPVAEHLNRSNASVAKEIPSPSDCGNKLVTAQTVVFNTTAASWAHVTNVAGNYITYGPSDEEFVLDKLVGAEGASWDPERVCLPGTRGNMLSIIHAWSRSLDAQNLFCLSGVAGAGKSAIAHTIAQALHKDGILASSFFFDRNDASRNTPRRLITTISRDIAMRHPAIAADIRTALETEPSLASASLSRQFEAFISGPLRRHTVNHPIVIIIDAVDEAIRDDFDTSLLSILRNEASDLPPQLRILITSRSTRIVDQYLSGQAHITSHPIDIHSLDNRQDIAAYVDAQMRDLLRLMMGPNWPDEAVITELKTMAEGLFIWIATVCNYLGTVYNPRAKLEALLSKSIPQGLAASKKMDVLYASILELCADWQDADFLKDYELVIGAIMAAKRPLSLMALKALHHPMELSANIILERFGSVLVGFKTDDEPIRMLHVSFREFITNNANNTEDTRKFYISEKLHNQRLAELCLQTMVREFADRKISGTGYLKSRGDDPPGIPEVTGISEQLLYSCESWSNHISDVTEPNPVIMEHLRAFVLDHTTVWMEIISSKSIFLGSLSAFCWLKDHAPEIRELCDDESQALSLSSLSRRLSYAGRLEEALTADQEAVHMYRTLVTERPAMFNSYLARSLINLSVNLSAIGRTEETLTVAHEAVDLHRTLAAERPTTFNGDLAYSLSNLSGDLAAVDHPEEALSAAQEAVHLYQTLAVERPAVFHADITSALNNLSGCLAAVGRMEEALTVMQDAVHMYRALAARRPSVFNAPLACSLNNLCIRLSAIGQIDEALTAGNEAVDLRRVLAAERPAVVDANLADFLTNLSGSLAAVGRMDEALAAVQEATYLRRALAAQRPTVFNGPLALSLTSLCAELSAAGKMDEALMAVQEAVDLRRALAAQRPAVFNADLAVSLTNLSASLAAVGRTEEALMAVQEAVHAYRTPVAERPAVLNDGLALSLTNLAVYLETVGQMGEALTAAREAVDLRRALVTEQPTTFNGGLAHSLTNLSGYLSAVGQTDEALTVVQEAVHVYRTLAAERPVVFNANLAGSLTILVSCLAAVGRMEEAPAVFQEAVDLHRTLAAERPAIFNDDLAGSLSNLSVYLSAVGRMEEALTAMQEAVNLRRALAAERPAIFNADLATALNNLSIHLAAVGRTEEALMTDQEVVHLYRTLAAERPVAFTAKFAESLHNISVDLLDIGRHEEALMAVQEAVELRLTLAAEQPNLYHNDLQASLYMLSAMTRSMRRAR